MAANSFSVSSCIFVGMSNTISSWFLEPVRKISLCKFDAFVVVVNQCVKGFSVNEMAAVNAFLPDNWCSN